MKLTYAVLSLSLCVAPGLANAHGPSRQKVEKTIDINAPAAKVWAVINEFCAIKDWHPAVQECESKGGTEAGTTRVLTLEGGGQIHEEMLQYNAEKMMYKYKITEVDVKVLPVTTYSASITVVPGEGDTSKVVWKGGFYRGFTNNDPPPELNDEAAVKAITGVYDAGLAKIKELAEK